MSTSFVALALEGMALEPRVRVPRLGSVTRSVHLFLGAGVRNDATRPSAMPSFQQALHIQVISLRTTATRCQKLPSGLQVLVEGSASCAPFAPTTARHMIESMNRTLYTMYVAFRAETFGPGERRRQAPLVSTFRTRFHKYARGYRLLWYHLRRGVVLDPG